MSHATDPRPAGQSAPLPSGFIDRVMERVRVEIAEQLGAQELLTEDQLVRLAEQVANLTSLGLFTSTTNTPVPFSGGTPMKKHTTPHTAYSNRDPKTVLKVEELCLAGVRKGYC